MPLDESASSGAEKPISSGVEEPRGTKRPRSPDKPGADEMPLDDLLGELVALPTASDQRDRVVDACRQLMSGVNKDGIRALAKRWGVAQKQSGKNRPTQDMRSEIEQKIREEARHLLRKSKSLVLKSLESQPLSDVEESGPCGAADTRVSPSGAQEPGASYAFGAEEPGVSGGADPQVSASFNLSAFLAAQTQKTPVGTKRKQPGVSSAGAEEPISSGVEEPRGTKRPQSPDKPGADKGHVAQESASAMVPLESHAVLKALDWLDRQQRSGRVDQLHKLVELWRAACAMKTAKEQWTHLLQVAATFDIVLSRKVQGRAATVSSTIGEAFKERVSALRSWQPLSATSVPQRLER